MSPHNVVQADHVSSVLPGIYPSVQIQESGENELAGILKCLGDTTVLKIDLVWLSDNLGNPGFVYVMTQERPSWNLHCYFQLSETYY